MIHTALHRIISGLARRTWLVGLVTIAVCAGFAARAVAALAEADYLSPPAGAASPLAPAIRKSAAPKAHPDANAFVDRNMFCSTCAHEAGPAGATYSGTPAVLIATSVGSQSRATVRVIPTEIQGSWGLGELIPGVGTIDHIGFASIDVIDSAGRRQRLALDDLPVSDHGVAGAATPGPGAPADPYADRIKKIDDHTYEVDRALVRELVTGGGNPNGMRATPVIEKGEIAGLRILAARAGSVGAAIGLKPGDKLTSINNDPIKSAQQMLNLFAQLDSLNVVQLQGTRANKPLQVELRLR
jgi:hypothetical protein